MCLPFTGESIASQRQIYQVEQHRLDKRGRQFQTVTVDIIDSQTRDVIARVDVGVDPVSIARRPDGKEVWVSNHVSDSVSVIDTDESSPTFLNVIATVQEFDTG